MSDSTSTSPAARIRDSLAEVESLRLQHPDPARSASVLAIKGLQAQRFRHTYADFLADARYALAARFFLEELYGAHDFRQRDAQFSRIAGAIERLFPEAVAELAVDLATTHALTERLDDVMAGHWRTLGEQTAPPLRYVRSWRLTGQAASRERQLSVVLHMGRELERLTRVRSLRTALRVMRRPASVAGLGELQRFLEDGFDAFAGMNDSSAFLAAIAQRESVWIQRLFTDEEETVAKALTRLLD